MDSTQKVKLILKDNNNIEVLKYLNNLDDVLVIGQFVHTIDNNSKKRKKILYGAVKDVESIDGNNYIIALNHGVTFFTYDKNDTKFKNYFTENFNGRSYCTNYDTVNNIIYAGTYKGLKIGNEFNVDYFTLDGQSLICNDILVFDNRVFLATQENGVLIFNKGKYIGSWNNKKDLVSNNVYQIKSDQNRLYLSTDKGFQILNLKGESLYLLTQSEGINIQKIVDFEIRNDRIYLLHKSGVLPIQINQLQYFNFKPNLLLKGVLVNDVEYPLSKSIFNYKQNKITFNLSSKSLKYKDGIKYQYQLIGVDAKWQYNSYENNIITRCALIKS